MRTWRGRTSEVSGHYGVPRKVMGEATATPSSQGRSFQIAGLPDVVIKVVRDQAAEAELACMREVRGEHASVSGFGVPSKWPAARSARARASRRSMRYAVLVWLPEILAHSDESSSATWREWRHTCVNTEVQQFGPLASRARRGEISVRAPRAAERKSARACCGA
jgi:hypothetical protein